MSNQQTNTSLSHLPQSWQIWRNPIFIRYRRSQLRLTALITGLLVYGGVSLFIYLVSLGIATTRSNTPIEQTTLIPFALILFLQLFIMNFVGTGAVASGMARESIDDVLTYQRLTPLSPFTKIVGYLAGLPVRQFYHFLVTLPVTALIVKTGNIPIDIWGPIYAVLITSTLMFYLLAMSVGFIMGKRFSALISQGLVALLYFVIPQLSKFGFVIFEYLTIRPALMSAAQKSTNVEFQFIDRQSALFYNWEVSHTAYCIAVQCLLSLIFFCLLLRRWRSESSHLLSKYQCITITVLMHILILGGIWANTANGSIFAINTQSRHLQVQAAEHALNNNVQIVGATILGIYGLIGFTIAILMQYIYTPSKYSYLAGLRQRKKNGHHGVGLLADSATAIPTSVIIAIITAGAWCLFGRHLAASPPMAEFLNNASWDPTESMLIAVTIFPLLAHGFAMEKYGRKLTGTFAGFSWVLPLAVALLLSAWSLSDSLSTVIYGLSPFAMDFAPGYLMAMSHTPETSDLFVQGAWVGVNIYLALSLYLLVKLIMRHRQLTAADDSSAT